MTGWEIPSWKPNGSWLASSSVLSWVTSLMPSSANRRVNRIDGDDKDYGYIVDYRDLFNSLERAITDYTGQRPPRRTCARRITLAQHTTVASEHRTIAERRSVRSDIAMVAPRDAPEPDSP